MSSPDNQHSSQWILSNLWVEEAVCEINIGSLLILHPLLQISGDENDVVHAPSSLCEISLEAWLSNIELASFGDSFFIVLQPVSHDSASTLVARVEVV